MIETAVNTVLVPVAVTAFWLYERPLISACVGFAALKLAALACLA